MQWSEGACRGGAVAKFNCLFAFCMTFMETLILLKLEYWHIVTCVQ